MFEKAFLTSHLGELLRFAPCGLCLQANASFFVPIGRSTKSPSHCILKRRKPFETAYWFNSIYMKFLNIIYPWRDARKCVVGASTGFRLTNGTANFVLKLNALPYITGNGF